MKKSEVLKYVPEKLGLSQIDFANLIDMQQPNLTAYQNDTKSLSIGRLLRALQSDKLNAHITGQGSQPIAIKLTIEVSGEVIEVDVSNPDRWGEI